MNTRAAKRWACFMRSPGRRWRLACIAAGLAVLNGCAVCERHEVACHMVVMTAVGVVVVEGTAIAMAHAKHTDTFHNGGGPTPPAPPPGCTTSACEQ